MTYGLRYNLGCRSHLHLWEIKIYEEGFAGTAVERALGASPVLVKDNSDAICGTSLELKLEAIKDGEFSHLYTTDANKYLVEEHCDGILYWKGFIVKEQMSEPYVAAPYDVNVRATDGLGILKSKDYDLSGRQSLLQILLYLLKKTGLSLDIETRSTLFAAGMNMDKSMLEQIDVDAVVLKGNCYEVLESILESLGMFVTQHNGRWLVSRWLDVNSKGIIYNSDGAYISNTNNIVYNLGAAKDCEPVGYMTMNILPAAKEITIINEYTKYPSLFLNHNFNDGFSGWTTEGNVVFRKNYAIVLPVTEVSKVVSKLARGALFAKDTLSIYFSCKYYIHGTYRQINKDGKFDIEIKCGSHYLSREGWTTTESVITVTDTIKAVPHADAMIDKMSTFEITADACPEGGFITVSFLNDHVKTMGGMGEVFGDVRVAITDVIFTMSTSKGVKTTVNIEENASKKASDVKIAFVSGTEYVNNTRLFPGCLRVNRSDFPATWYVGGYADSFFNHMVSSIVSNIKNAKKELTGTITGRDLSLNMIIKDNVCGKVFTVYNGTYNQYEEEIEITLQEIMSFAPINRLERLSPRAVNSVVLSDFRTIDDTNNYRSYAPADGSPFMIRDLNEGVVNFDTSIEIDNNNERSERSNLNEFRKLFWDRMIMTLSDKGYLTVDNTPIKSGYADDSEMWSGHLFDDYIDQALRTIDTVSFAKVISSLFQTPNYSKGPLGSGTSFDESGIETDNITVRKTFNVVEWVIQKLSHQGGLMILSPGSGKITRVELGVSTEGIKGFKCYIDTSVNPNQFKGLDLVRCQVYTKGKEKYYWTFIDELGADWIFLASENPTQEQLVDGIVNPEVGDELCVCGNYLDKTRQGALILSSIGLPYIAVYANINSCNLTDKEICRIGFDSNGIPGVSAKSGTFEGYIKQHIKPIDKSDAIPYVLTVDGTDYPGRLLQNDLNINISDSKIGGYIYLPKDIKYSGCIVTITDDNFKKMGEPHNPGNRCPISAIGDYWIISKDGTPTGSWIITGRTVRLLAVPNKTKTQVVWTEL